MAATVFVRPLNGTWQPIGGLVDRGVWHEDLVLVSDQWGPKSATFTLKRQLRASFPDLLTRTRVVVEVGGVRVWAGRIKEVPEQSGAARQLTVQCEGGQYLLDDDQLERVLVHADLTAYKDHRSSLTAALGNGVSQSPQAYSVTTDQVITIGVTEGSSVGNFSEGSVILDLGPGQAAKTVAVRWSGGGDANFALYVLGEDTPGAGTESAALDAAPISTSTTATFVTFSSGRRYVRLALVNTSGAAVAGTATSWARIEAVTVFADSAYQSSGTSILDAGTIIRDTLTRTNLATALHPDWTGVGAPSFAFPNFAPDKPMTPRELITAANAPHGWRFKIDENLKPLYRDRAAVPAVELGAWLGAESDSGSSNSDEGIVTKVTVRGTGPDGLPVRSSGTQSGTIVDRQGGVATVTLDTSYKLDSTLADKLRDTYLVTHRTSPFKGQNVLTAGGARRTGSWAPVDPAHLLLLTSELARRTDLIDPDTGALGRVAVIDQVTYTDATESAQLDLDNTRTVFEALQERLGLLVPA